jgi:hypothetical protein
VLAEMAVPRTWDAVATESLRLYAELAAGR